MFRRILQFVLPNGETVARGQMPDATVPERSGGRPAGTIDYSGLHNGAAPSLLVPRLLKQPIASYAGLDQYASSGTSNGMEFTLRLTPPLRRSWPNRRRIGLMGTAVQSARIHIPAVYVGGPVGGGL